MNSAVKILQGYFDEHATPEVKAIAAAGKKTIAGAYSYIRSYAAKRQSAGVYMMADDEAFGLLLHYMEFEAEGAKVDGKNVAAPSVKKTVKKASARPKTVPVKFVPPPMATQLEFAF